MAAKGGVFEVLRSKSAVDRPTAPGKCRDTGPHELHLVPHRGARAERDAQGVPDHEEDEPAHQH